MKWLSAAREFREQVLRNLPDAAGIDADTPWDELPYWVRRHVAHFVEPREVDWRTDEAVA